MNKELHREEKPWGDELWLCDKEKPSMVKILHVRANAALSLQYHHNRDELWHVISGNGKAIIGEDEVELAPGDTKFVPKEIRHRLIGGTEDLKILELSFGNYDSDDIVRLEDNYGRICAQ